MNSKKTSGCRTDAAGNIVIEKSVPMNSENEVLGTCRVEMDLDFRAGSPELEALLAKVTADGLPYNCGYTRINGSGLEELIAAKTNELRGCLRLSLDELNDADLVMKCTAANSTNRAIARDLLTDRIRAGRPGAFAALLAAHAAATDRDHKLLLQELIDKSVWSVADSVTPKGAKELQRLASSAASDPVVAYAAEQRLALRGRRDADLKAIPGMPLTDLVGNIEAGRYAYDSAVKTAANKRARAETLGSGDVALLLPLYWWAIDDFLNEQGLQALGRIESWRSRSNRTRWNKAQVVAAIELTTARLYHRARHEFYGRLPDKLHNRMVLADGDEFAKDYIEFLEEKDRANDVANELD